MRLELAYECFPDTNLTGVMHLAYRRNFALVELSELLIGALNLDLVLHKRLLNELIAETRFILLALWDPGDPSGKGCLKLSKSRAWSLVPLRP